MKYSDNGTFKDIYVKASDTLPVGAEVEFDGENIPGGYEVSTNPNLFDGTTIVSGKGLNGTTGQPYDASSRSYYEYMEALENRTYILKDITPASICFYDSTQTFISSVSGEMTFTTPADTAYIRVAFNNTVPYTGASLTRQIQRIKKVEQSIGVLGKVLNTQSSSNQDTYSCDYINDLKPTVLWTNPNPTATTFAAQDIVLSETIANYTYYEIIFIAYANASLSLDTFLSTGKLIGERTRLFYADNYIRRRLVSGVSGTNMTFGDGGSCTTYGTDTWGTSNALCVPYKVIGYK